MASPNPYTHSGLGPTAHPLPIDPQPINPLIPTSDAPIGDLDVTANQQQDVDPQILEALRSKDRLYVLKLGELMEGLINERRARVELAPSTSYQRLLVHRCSAYYKLQPESDPVTKGIAVVPTPDSRIPVRRLCELVPAESTAHPTFKIMRRSAQDRSRSKPQSHTGSVAGEDADLSDVEPSESGSIGGRSNATGGSNKKRMTIEEREAAYNEARSRIFMDFEEKEKERDMSASSSSLSLVSGSASTNGGTGCSSIDGFEDSVSSPATESEWSGSIARDKKDSKLGLGGVSATLSRSLRSAAPPFNTNGSGSSRGSRASSPSFTFASLYEPPAVPSPYDPGQISGQVPGPGYMAPYIYPYHPPGQSHHPPYFPPYQLYAPYSYQQNMVPSDTQNQDGGNLYSPTHPVGYENPYGWSNPPQPPPPMQHPPPTAHSRQTFNHTAPPLLQSPVQYQPPYMAPLSPYAPFPVPGYYPPPHSDPHVPQPNPHIAPQPVYTREPPRFVNGNGTNHNSRNLHGNGGSNGTNSSRTSSRGSSGPGINGGSKRSTVPVARSTWSYGTAGMGHGGTGAIGVCGSSISGSDVVVGPRLSSGVRRGSGTSVGSTGNWTSTGDEASSTTSSSTTSSSSRRTYTSTSSHHPLPPRPDWAVGLKPQPTLHSTHPRHHDSSRSDWPGGLKLQSTVSPQRNPLNISPSTPNGSQSQTNNSSQQAHGQQIPPASPDFPPLTSVMSSPEKRTPVVTGAWTNSSSMRSILLPGSGRANSPGNVLVHHPNSGAGPNTMRLEESDRASERPSPKGNGEPFSPRIVRRPVSIGKLGSQVQDKGEKDNTRGDVVASAILVGQVLSLSLDDPSTDPTKELVVCGNIPNVASG